MKPMLAAKIKDTSTLNYPVFASAKLDGVRCIISNGVALSRSLKPIPNEFVQKCLSSGEYEGCDGELIIGDPGAKDVYRKTVSGVMAHAGEPDFCYYVFDKWNMGNAGYKDRLDSFFRQFARSEVVPQYKIESEIQLLELEKHFLNTGVEGLIVRGINSPYKHGRSTLKQGYLLKLKRFVDDEAVIVGFQELYHNANEAFTNELGQTAHSHHQANMVPMSMLGTLVVRNPEICDQDFEIGTGFSREERTKIWQRSNDYLGKTVKFKYFPIGMKDKPRHPVFLGMRDRSDM